MFLGRFFLLSYVFITIAFLGRSAFADTDLQIATACHMNAEGGKIYGENIDERIPMASVSKVITAEWAVSQRGFDYRYPTFVDIYHTSKPGVFDVHLRGSKDPFFDLEQMHFLISELNKLDITHIRTLSFDEGFKFTRDAIGQDRSSIRTIELPLGAPFADTIQSNLEQPLLTNYSRTRRRASASGIELVANPEIKVDKVEYRPSNLSCSVKSKQADISKVIYSAPMKDLLREMNRKSNNYAADQIFESLGGMNAYADYAYKKFKMTKNEIKMGNGSGAPLFEDIYGNETEKYYNEATCRSVLTILKSLRDQAKSVPNGLASVMVVAGADRDSSLGGMYSIEILNNSMVAKTGTINTNVSLGGLVLAKDGSYLFYENIDTGITYWNSGRNNQARQLIRKRVSDIITEYGGPSPQSFEINDFFTYGADVFDAAHGCSFKYRFTPGEVQYPPAIVVTANK